MEIALRPVDVSDSPDLARIYTHYVEGSWITFETDPVSAEAMVERVQGTMNSGLPWLVAVQAGRVSGYALATPWKGRCAYRFSVETSIYLDPEFTGMGIGTSLYTALLDELRSASMRTAIGGIALPNEASIRLHERLGFEKVAHFREVGFKLDRWVDVGYWQLKLG